MTGRPPVERITLECAACGKEVTRRVTDLARNTSGRVFCSNACLRKVGAKPRSIPERSCETCGTMFRPLQHKAVGRFCSTACFNEAQRGLPPLTCEMCGSTFRRSPSQAQVYGVGRFCSRACVARASYKNHLDREHNGKPARLTKDGYVLVWQPDHPNALGNGWVAEHRLVASEMIGRPLDRGDEVHHINRIRTDNRPENLEVLDGATHSVITNNQRRNDRDLLAEYIRRYGPLDSP